MNFLRPATLIAPLILAGLCCEVQSHTVPYSYSSSVVIRDRSIDGTLIEHQRKTIASLPNVQETPITTTDSACSATPVAWQGQSLPNGESGTLNPYSFTRSATLNNLGRIAFISSVDGAERNQGLFVADTSGVRAIAMGCGGSGGTNSQGTCGDASPLGGTFSGFFRDTGATPDINDHGDVLFLADVLGGSAVRGLFLYKESDQSITKVAAVGDPSPLGGTLTALGAGVINNAGTIAFLAASNGSMGGDILTWNEGAISKYVAVGDPAPGGGTFSFIATENWGYPDGTSLIGGPVPSINQNGVIAFRGYVTGGIAAGGQFLSIAGSHGWMVKAGDPAPGGGIYQDFQAPILNDNNDIAFLSHYDANSAGWVVGNPGMWRRAMTSGEVIDGGTVVSIAYSRNPMRALANNGDLAVWTARLLDGQERGTMLVNRADGENQILAVQSTPTPFGGYWGGSMDGWPTINNLGQIQMGSATPGFAVSADVLITPCAPDRLFKHGFDPTP